MVASGTGWLEPGSVTVPRTCGCGSLGLRAQLAPEQGHLCEQGREGLHGKSLLLRDFVGEGEVDVDLGQDLNRVAVE